MSEAVDFVVRRSALGECRFVPAAAPSEVKLEPGEVLLAVDRFALTANNVTYGVAGDMIGYWSFFPAEEGWGRIPVWGFGDVVRSKHEGVREGERLYGYYPMSSWLVIRPASANPAMVVDGSAHRKDLPPIYNQYVRSASDPLYTKDTESWLMLFRPLFLTAFLIDDYLADAELFGAHAIVLTSASSKTSFGLASLLTKHRRAPGNVIGLTSKRNVGFVEGLGCYDRVVTYEDVASFDAKTPVAIVDMAGNADLLGRLHRHFGEGVKASILVGLTHHDQMGGTDGLPGAKPAFFFAPDQAVKRAKDWGPAGLQERIGTAWRGFLEDSKDWIRVVEGRGPEAVEKVYRETLEGRVSPSEGHILSLRAK